MEIINVYVEGNTFMSTVRKVRNDDEVEERTEARRINGTDGTMELVSLEMTGKRTKEEILWPSTEEEWIVEQEKDTFCKKLMEEMIEPDSRKNVTANPVDPSKVDFYFRSTINGQQGMLKRRTHILTIKRHLSTEIQVVEQLNQYQSIYDRIACLCYMIKLVTLADDAQRQL
jgi:hypothetical protein